MQCPPIWGPDGEPEIYTYHYICKYHGKIFDILLSPDTPLGYDSVDSIERKFLQRLEATGSCEGDDEDDVAKMMEESDRASKEILVDVLKAARPLMESLAPETQDMTPNASFHSVMYPEIIKLQIVTKQRQLLAIKDDNLPTFVFHPPITDSQLLGLGLPTHDVSDIELLGDLYMYTYKVRVDGQIMCAKVTRSAPHESISDEIRKLHQIQTTKFDSLVRVPKINGIITSDTGIIGFLIDYIPSLCYDLGDALRCAKATASTTLEERDGPPMPVVHISKAQREKWSCQIEDTLKALHTRDIIWGDAKMANVLIDELTDDAWVIDFGGGNDRNWVDPELHGTVAGDLQALERIKRELADD